MVEGCAAARPPSDPAFVRLGGRRGAEASSAAPAPAPADERRSQFDHRRFRTAPPRRRLAARSHPSSAPRLEWPHGVIDLLSPGWLLKIARPTAPPIGDSSLGNLVVGNAIVERYVFGFTIPATVVGASRS